MTSEDAPVDLYIAAYADEDAAQQDWDELKRLVKDKLITVDGIVLVRRDDDGKIHVRDNARDIGVGAVIGAVGGAIVGLIFPPSIIAAAVVGAGIGAGGGALLDHHQKSARSRRTSKTSSHPVTPASLPCSRSAGFPTSKRHSQRPTRSPSARSTARAPSR